MSSGAPPFTFGPWRFPFRLRLRQYAYPQYVSPNTLRPPVFTPTNFAPPHQVDFQFPNVALQAFAQSRVHPVGAVLDETIPAPQPRQLDLIPPNLLAIQPSAPVSARIFDRQPPSVQPPDFQFPNVALQAFAQSLVHPQGAMLDESVPVVFPRPIDFQFANVAALNAAQLLVKSPTPKLDFAVPAPQQRQLDLIPPNLLPIQPVAAIPPATRIFDRPAPAIQARDFLFPNLLASIVYSPAGAVWGPWPQPLLPPQDIIPPNLAVRQPVTTAQIFARVFDYPALQPRQLDLLPINLAIAAPVTPPSPNTIRSPVFTVQPQPVRQLDFQFPNIPVTTVVAAALRASTVSFDRPPPAPQQPDFQFPNLALAPTVFVFRAPLIMRQAPVQPPTDPPLPNLLATTLSTPPQKPVVPPLFGDRPTPQTLPQDYIYNNLLLALSTPPQKPRFSPIFERPIAVSLPVDAPIPNLLTTTLSVVAQKPPFNFIFERPAPLALPWDQAPVNLLPTLLQTIARKPIVPNLFLFADRPSPQAPPVDFPPPNSLVFKPPPVVNLELHQNPFLTTMGRMSQLGNLPS